MIFEELKYQYKKIIGWGTGGAYDKQGRMYEEYIDYMIDSNPLKWGTEIGSLSIQSPDRLLLENSEECVIIIFSSFVEEIHEGIKLKGNFDVVAGSVVNYFCEAKIQLSQKKELSKVFSELNWNQTVCCVSTMAYTTSVGGGNKFVFEQNKILRSKGYEVLHIVPLQYYCSFCEDGMIWLTCNEKTLGIYSLSEILIHMDRCRSMIIHSPYYAVRSIGKIYKKMKALRWCLFYLHDFACVCSKRFLPVEDKECFEELKTECVNCEEGENRRKLSQEYQKLFYNDNVLLIAPSRIVADKVSEVYPKARLEVVPHYVYEIEETQKQVNQKLKIAFLGAANKTKGYEEFKKIVCELNHLFEFYCFGRCSDKDKIEGVEYVEIHMEGNDEHLCMKDALIQYEIDMAYLGSICCETYSFTYIEAFESAVYVLTTEMSGNICEAVKKNKNGYVAKDTDDLIYFLKKEDLELKDILLKQNRKIVKKHNNLIFLGAR